MWNLNGGRKGGLGSLTNKNFLLLYYNINDGNVDVTVHLLESLKMSFVLHEGLIANTSMG